MTNVTISGQVTPESSVFTYSQGKTTADYQHLDFMPTFRDEADPAKVAEAENFCGKGNDGCIFDYLVTNNANFAQHTRDAQDKQETFSRNLGRFICGLILIFKSFELIFPS